LRISFSQVYLSESNRSAGLTFKILYYIIVLTRKDLIFRVSLGRVLDSTACLATAHKDGSGGRRQAKSGPQNLKLKRGDGVKRRVW
jgi:hypothetical protein